MTKVIGCASKLFGIVVTLCLVSLPAWSGNAPAGNSNPAASLTAEALYQQLGNVELDPGRVYKVRGTNFNRGPIQISLDDGTIAFTKDVAGRVTGAFFEGDGEVLLLPPDQVERSSMALFTGAAILEERFVSAYFRFNDDSFAESQETLRPADNTQDFVAQWNPTAKNLAAGDAFRLFLSFSEYLPLPDPSRKPANSVPENDRVLHARLQGRKLGTFDLYYDAAAAEQIWAGQLKRVESGTYFDVWTSFSLPQPGEHRTVSGITGEEGKSDTLGITAYKIRAEVTPPTTVNAEAALQIDVRQGGQRAALFELSRFLQVKSVEADGHPVDFIHNPALEGSQLERRGNDLVAVVFPEPLRTGQKVQLRFVYGGEVLSEAGGGLLYVGARGTWYPNRGLAMADYDIEFQYPPGWTLLATGKRVEEGASKVPSAPAEPRQASRWVSERPIPVAGFNLGKYSHAVAQAADVKIEAYAASGMEAAFPKARAEVVVPEMPSPGRRHADVIVTTPPPPVPTQNMQKVADQAAKATEFFSQRFGPYPYSHLALTQMPGNLSQGWPGLIFLSSLSFLTTAEKNQLHMPDIEQDESEIIVPHETAHEWWGDLIGWSGYRDQWLFEALANYSAMMLVEAQSPPKFRLLMDTYRKQLLQKNKDGLLLLEGGPVTLGSRLSNSRFSDGYEAISYGRGTWLIHMLRSMVNDGDRKSANNRNLADAADEPFVRNLRKIRDRYQGKSITTREFINAFAEDLPPSLRYEGHKSLDWFYDGWVRGTAIPHFDVQGVKYLDRGSSTIVSGTILQKSAPKDLVTSVPMYAILRGKAMFLGRVFAEGPEAPFKLTAPLGVRKVILDPDQSLLARLP